MGILNNVHEFKDPKVLVLVYYKLSQNYEIGNLPLHNNGNV